ncbi:U6 snRNA-associated Sm-like protein LSm1 [Coemansia reversa NRRL 1564]|uniref:U6 snRNA-associated Sm-like protein LSm1 n=1 Tax=Coemansia reversa (strain ATCC 12441 / NRRL 1564) TaxID=763665 RepID=A0A2G5B9G0_COERN|nr:U6 snRNA-associated Sm-like protein LSm1 [Coemansia reversa NRRL 1564]|eukprot:PIA15644.1 U6 snRNA-associated Sm-like protein LSm1 [Coemansia reversa NRRL 1564]
MSFTPQFFTTAESLVDSLDKKVLVILRDGRKVIGVLRSYDQFANLVLQDSLERIYVGDAYGDIERGVFIIRGENVVLLGEIDGNMEDTLPLRQLSVQEILQRLREEAEEKARKDKLRFQLLRKQGFSVDFADNDLY